MASLPYYISGLWHCTHRYILWDPQPEVFYLIQRKLKGTEHLQSWSQGSGTICQRKSVWLSQWSPLSTFLKHTFVMEPFLIFLCLLFPLFFSFTVLILLFCCLFEALCHINLEKYTTINWPSQNKLLELESIQVNKDKTCKEYSLGKWTVLATDPLLQLMCT